MRLAPSVALLIAVSALSQTAGKRADLDGVWILLRAQVGTLRLTPEGEKKRAAYDFQKDDPDFQCKPASFTRVMHTPSPPIEVRQREDHVEVRTRNANCLRAGHACVARDSTVAMRHAESIRMVRLPPARRVRRTRLTWLLKTPPFQ